MARRKRAAFGDESGWSESTLIEVERHIRSFKAACAREGQDDTNPEERWLAKHLQDVREDKGRSYATRHARNTARTSVPSVNAGAPLRRRWWPTLRACRVA
jgi:hypothetical protein